MGQTTNKNNLLTKYDDNWDNLPPSQANTVLVRVLRDLSRSKDNPRALVLTASSFLDEMIKTLIKKKCKHNGVAQRYHYAIKLVFLNEMNVISDDTFKSLEWLRSRRNPAAHHPVFEIPPQELRKLDQEYRDPKNLHSLCLRLIGGLWNQYSELFTAAFAPGASGPVHFLESDGHRLIDIEIYNRSAGSHQKPSPVDVSFFIQPENIRPKIQIRMLAASGQMDDCPNREVIIGPEPDAKPGDPVTCNVPAGYYLVDLWVIDKRSEHRKSWIMDILPPHQKKVLQLEMDAS